MVLIAQGWNLEVERGPDWLFVRPVCDADHAESQPPLAEQVWTLLDQYFTYRVVLELEEVPLLHSYLIGQLIWLHKRVTSHGGIMRLSGLSTRNREILRQCQLEGRLPPFGNRCEAVLTAQPLRSS